MGQSSSTDQISPAQREAETLAASTGALPTLREAFSRLSDPETGLIPLDSIRKCFALVIENPSSGTSGTLAPKEFPVLLAHVGSAIVDQFFLVEKAGLTWVEFLRGYTKCCGRTVASTSLNNLFKLVFVSANEKAGLPVKLQVDPSEDDDGKLSGSLLPADLLNLLWACWTLSWDSRNLRSSTSKGSLGRPDVDHLVLSAVESCAESADKLNFWDAKTSGLDIELPVSKVLTWALKTVPYLADCLAQFVNSRLGYLTSHQGKWEDLYFPVHGISPAEVSNTGLLTCGRAWAISLTLRDNLSEEISKACFLGESEDINESLLYRSSLHGKGLNRFWSHVEGYLGPVIMLIDACESNNVERRLTIGALTHQGFENKDIFYGSSGNLYALGPVFHVFAASGKEKNFIYSHLHPAVRVYDPHPKPVGIAFGGSIGNERVFMDEDFSKVTLRHHAVDKTYQHGSLFPNQGFLPTEMSVLEVEIWGLGGKRAKDVQTSYKKREEIFTEQRRKVDLKAFGDWEDSPEKMMMDMMADPNRVRRQDR
ncbi:OLC1v1018176C3 [Oldenlandia corymbosa var. corymbosa]|uniref:OLC1v1018176C3 n=1 Tax=Oldenlandia corymbosa var. corymbosa TaxID=529605 RepID=A0AAV1EB28_OLDCO|nr:OLC1v1018176C3 [Oldenlandia corymbosa var. corymbosa]